MNIKYSNYIIEQIEHKGKGKIPKDIKKREFHDTNEELLNEIWKAYHRVEYDYLLMQRLKHYVYFKALNESKKRDGEIKNDIILSQINKMVFDTEEERQMALNLSIHDYEVISAACNLFLEEHKDDFSQYIIDGKALLDYKPKELEAKIDEKFKILSDILTICYGEYGENNGILTKNHTNYIRDSIGIDSLPQDYNFIMNKMYSCKNNEEEFLSFLNEGSNKKMQNKTAEDTRPFIPLDAANTPFIVTLGDNPLMNSYESIRIYDEMSDKIISFLFRSFLEFDCLVYIESILSQNCSQSIIENFLKAVKLAFTCIYKNSPKDEPNKELNYEGTSIPKASKALLEIDCESVFENFQNLFLEDTMPIIRNYISKNKELRHSFFDNYWGDFGGIIYGAIRDTINNALVLSNESLMDYCEDKEYEIKDFLVDISKRLENDYYILGNYEKIKKLKEL